MSNTLGDGKIMNVHCQVVDGMKMDHSQKIPNNDIISWKFRFVLDDSLSCNATVNIPGVQTCPFLAYKKALDTCRDSCSWNFRQAGVFKLNHSSYM